MEGSKDERKEGREGARQGGSSEEEGRLGEEREKKHACPQSPIAQTCSLCLVCVCVWREGGCFSSPVCYVPSHD